jgi:hypothetical protein
VLRALEGKRSLFEGVFSGTSDEVLFESLGQQAFLLTVRSLVGAEPPPEEPAPAPPAPQPVAVADPRQALMQAGVQFLEALAALFAAASKGAEANGSPAPLVATDVHGQPVLQVPLPSPEVLQRGAAALQALLRGLGERPAP